MIKFKERIYRGGYMIKVLIVDDQVLVRQGLVTLLSMEEDLEIVGEAADGVEALKQVGFLQPDIVLMDLNMPNKNGMEATEEIKKKYPGTNVLILTTFDEDEKIMRVLGSGATGYLLKDSPSEKLAAAIRAVQGGFTQLSPTITPKVLAMMSSSQAKDNKALALLSTRELQIVELVGEGKTNKEIAETLYITHGTVKNYVTKVLGKLDLRDRTQLAIWAKDNL